MCRSYRSFVVDTEDDSSAEEGVISEGEGGEVVVLHVPEALWGNSNTLSLHLSNNGLHYDLVRWYAEALNGGLDFVSDSLGHVLGMSVVILLVLQVMGH